MVSGSPLTRTPRPSARPPGRPADRTPDRVQRTVSVPSGSGWSNATADSRYRFSRPRNRATTSRVCVQPTTSSPKVAVPRSVEQHPQGRGVFGDRDRGGVDVVQVHGRAVASAGTPTAAIAANCSGVIPICDLRQQAEIARLQRHRPRVPAQRTGLEFGEQRGDLLVGAVGQQPGEQQVPGLEHVVVHAGRLGRSASGSSRAALRSSRVAAMTRNSVTWSRSQFAAHRPDVPDEVVGDLVQRDLGDVHPALVDQLQQQVERPVEVVQPDMEGPASRR